MSERFEAIGQWFEALTDDTLPTIGTVYAPDATFKDQFNDVVGLERIRQVYQHMFDNLDHPKFIVDSVIGEGSQGCLIWRLTCAFKGRPITVHGSTHLVLDQAGLVATHRDYWDTSEEVFERIPVLGSILRMLKRRMAG